MYSHHLDAICRGVWRARESMSIWEQPLVRGKRIQSIYFINSVTKWERDRARENELDISEKRSRWNTNKYLNLVHVHRPKLTSHWAHIRGCFIVALPNVRDNTPKWRERKNITNWKTIREFRIYWNVLWNWEWSCARSGNGMHVDLSGGEAANGKIWFDQTHLSLRCHTSVDKMQSSLYQISFALTFFFQKKEFIRGFVLFVFVTAAWSARTHPI